MNRLVAILLVLAAAGGACTDESPRWPVTGRWVGTPALAGAPWSLDMSVTQNGASVTGSATRSNYAAVPYLVTGDQVGDSVFLLMRPPEDVDLRFALRPGRDRLAGVMWFGTNRASQVAVSFDRQ